MLAALNELIWRTQSTDFWVNFKLFGFVPLTFAFAALQYPLMVRYAVHAAPESETGPARETDRPASDSKPAA